MAIDFNNRSGLPTTISYPRYLFRYLSWGDRTIESLTNGFLWFCRLPELNDPFDCQNVITFEGSKYAFREFAKNIHRVTGQPRATVGDTAKRLRTDKELQRNYIDWIKKQTMEGSFLCCFSETPESTLMWSHYGSSHQGICLAFDTDILMMLGKYRILDVDYIDRPEAIRFPELYLTPPSPLREYKIQRAFFGSKLKEWAYEREVRLISNVGGKNLFPTKALVGVIIGARVPETVSETIETHIGRSYPIAKVVKADLNVGRGAVEVKDFKNTYLRRDMIQVITNAAGEHMQYFSGPRPVD